MITASSAPWSAPLTQPEYLITMYVLVVAALAMFAGFIRSWVTQHEVGSRFRPAIVARLAITAVAFGSYLILLVNFVLSYDHVGEVYVPTDNALVLFAVRYMDWSLTVPLLTVELLAVCSVVGARARHTRFVAATLAFLMIFTGFLGGVVIGGGEDTGALILWGSISSVFWILTNIVLVRAVRASFPEVTPAAAAVLRSATILLLSGWVVYPLVFLIQIFGSGGGWATTMQVALCVADVTVKIGFGTLIQRVAKLRTAEDVRAGDDVHPESIWISSVKQSDAGMPLEVYLATGASIHERRPKPPAGTAVAAAEPEAQSTVSL